MSDPKKTFGQMVGGGLVNVLIGAVAMLILGALVGIFVDGVTGVFTATAQGSQNSAAALGQAHTGITQLTQKALQVIFAVASFIALSAFLGFLLKKIITALKGP